jgi:hypothetical protein
MFTKVLAATSAVALVAGISLVTVSGSSHNDAPLIAEDPAVNNTDVYAFVSTQEGRGDYVTLMANYIPMQEPGNGPTHYRFSDKARYEIHVDTDGDAKDDLIYRFEFRNNVVNGNTILYNTAPIGLPPSPADPASQYTGLNLQQSYDLTEIWVEKNAHASRERPTRLLTGARVAPANVGPVSTPDYEALAAAAVHTVGSAPNEFKVFVGARDEGFYVDLMGVFDLFGGLTGPTRDPKDTFNGFNVHTIALEIPKSRFANAYDTDGIIGVWASASRPRITILGPGAPSTDPRAGQFVQVSRLGNALVNELLMPLDKKDQFNASQPKDDVANGFPVLITDPETSQGPAAIIPLLDTITGCTPGTGRVDLDLILLKGIPAGTLGLPGNQDTQQSGGPATAEMLRLNFNVAPSASPSPLGPFGGDPAGFPNGRRVGDDVVDVFARAGAGAVLELLGAIDCDVSLGISDGVQENDVPYLASFPYLGTPHQGYDHEHDHGSAVLLASLSIGAGLLFGGLALGSVLVQRRRRSSLLGS